MSWPKRDLGLAGVGHVGLGAMRRDLETATRVQQAQSSRSACPEPTWPPRAPETSASISSGVASVVRSMSTSGPGSTPPGRPTMPSRTGPPTRIDLLAGSAGTARPTGSVASRIGRSRSGTPSSALTRRAQPGDSVPAVSTTARARSLISPLETRLGSVLRPAERRHAGADGGGQRRRGRSRPRETRSADRRGTRRTASAVRSTKSPAVRPRSVSGSARCASNPAETSSQLGANSSASGTTTSSKARR